MADIASPQTDLTGKVAVVTGAGRGIGRATALELSALGAAVVVNDIGGSVEGLGDDSRPAETVAEEVRQAGGRAVANYDSVAEDAAAARIVQAAVDSFGCIDILVNNAGIVASGPIWEIEPDVFERVVRTHLFGAFSCTRHACRLMKEQGWGRIVNLVSRAGLLGTAGSVAYGSGKGGMYALTNTTARDLAPFGITVNAVNPAATRTRMVTDAIDRAKAAGQDTSAAERMIAQMQEPVDVAVLIAYLCTDAAAGINGQTFIAQRGKVGLVPAFGAHRSLDREGDGSWSVTELAASFPQLGVPALELLY